MKSIEGEKEYMQKACKGESCTSSRHDSALADPHTPHAHKQVAPERPCTPQGHLIRSVRARTQHSHTLMRISKLRPRPRTARDACMRFG